MTRPQVTGLKGGLWTCVPYAEAFNAPPKRGPQERIADEHLLISQVSFWQYSSEPFEAHRYHFPERNELMAAIFDATVIVEASDTSGTLTQARACLRQGRPLFIMKSLLDNGEVTWPAKYAGKPNVFVLEDTQQILDEIGEGDA
ncbi:MAG: DNA-processing protein DprA [Eggerthellaceae bacterium]|nr:DNA-processing protein DprA [Eggerthellaceae bacterium]